MREERGKRDDRFADGTPGSGTGLACPWFYINHDNTGGRVESKTKLLDQMRIAMRLRHMSLRTEKAYVQWARRFILFHNKRHPKDMGAEDIGAFLTALAVERQVATSTQNFALSVPVPL
jgi:hypothetical protein